VKNRGGKKNEEEEWEEWYKKHNEEQTNSGRYLRACGWRCRGAKMVKGVRGVMSRGYLPKMGCEGGRWRVGWFVTGCHTGSYY